MNSATLSGAIDVIVVEQPDGTMLSTPFHVRFGKYGVFNYDDKYVDIQINNEEIDLKMKLGENGVAFFVEKPSDETELPSHLETSPLPDEIDETDGASRLTPSAKESKSGDQIRPVKRSPRKDSAVVRPRKGSSSSDDELPVQKRPPQQQRQKKMLPFSSSIYSCRENRSLPDLSILPGDYIQNDINSQIVSARVMVVGECENGKKKSKHKRKATFGAIDMQKMINENNVAKNVNVGIIHHSKSASVALKNVIGADLNLSSSLDLEKSSPYVNGGQQQSSSFSTNSPQNDEKEESKQSNSPESSTKTTFFCSSDDEEDHNIENSNNNLLKPPINSNVASDIADGALSDPEVDRQGNSPDMNDPEWKWGEIPKSSKTKDSSRSTAKKIEKQGRWNWFRWSRQPQQDEGEETTDGDKLAKNNVLADKKEEEKQQGKGLYLQDLGNDPAKLEKYFGTRSGAMSISSNASNFDSGKGVSLGTSPSSALSINDETDTATLTGIVVDGINKPNCTAHSLENLTVTAENIIGSTSATSISTPTAILEKSKDKPTSRSRFDSGHSDASCATDLNLSDEEFLATTAKAIISGPSKKYKRSLRLSSDQLKLLNLDYGSNDARFSITTKFQGTAWCSCHIYLLRWCDKLVISDIDGTITKSDVLGHVIPAIGGTWAHSGVAELYTRIKNNGYQMVYLSSRAIGQSHYTKTYLQSIAQGSQTLPDGPVLLSPTSVLMAFKKEVIERRPEEFKIACLSDLKSLFPINRPFFAGFGNRETDVKSYKAVDVPLERILIINPSGCLRRADKIAYVSDYMSMAIDTVDFIFPPISLYSDPSLEIECSEFKTWRCDPQSFEYLVDQELQAYEERRKKNIADEEEALKKRKSLSRNKRK
ncbi:hypothetical protein ACQ4LE_010175 [Meloidogyne hapla]